ncbi:hypothetical protein [Kingella potus]|uniref:hypothetical protein n=1 Tax=Kingella potus TaxID=265175 RepID=UPI001FD292A3|nr:hypothetical protein [Kingella potus]UOP00702.1 hypothetical protein LVJ84_13045 [Kingella potus]
MPPKSGHASVCVAANREISQQQKTRASLCDTPYKTARGRLKNVFQTASDTE